MTAATTLTTDRLTLRQPKASDLPAYTAYCADPRSHHVGGPFSAAQAFDKFAAMIGHWTLRSFGRYVMIHKSTPIGHVGPLASHSPDRPELTWTLWDSTCEGHGYATEAAMRVRDHILQDLNWRALFIHVRPENTRSRRIAERIGATQTTDPAPDGYDGCLTYRLTGKGRA